MAGSSSCFLASTRRLASVNALALGSALAGPSRRNASTRPVASPARFSHSALPSPGTGGSVIQSPSPFGVNTGGHQHQQRNPRHRRQEIHAEQAPEWRGREQRGARCGCDPQEPSVPDGARPPDETRWVPRIPLDPQDDPEGEGPREVANESGRAGREKNPRLQIGPMPKTISAPASQAWPTSQFAASPGPSPLWAALGRPDRADGPGVWLRFDYRPDDCARRGHAAAFRAQSAVPAAAFGAMAGLDLGAVADCPMTFGISQERVARVETSALQGAWVMADAFVLAPRGSRSAKSQQPHQDRADGYDVARRALPRHRTPVLPSHLNRETTGRERAAA
jgi:hypothetical protein